MLKRLENVLIFASGFCFGVSALAIALDIAERGHALPEIEEDEEFSKKLVEGFEEGLENGKFVPSQGDIKAINETLISYPNFNDLVFKPVPIEKGSGGSPFPYSSIEKEERDKIVVGNNYGTENDIVSVEVPYIISEDDYNNRYPDFQKISYQYYEKDDVVTDERDEVVIDWEDIIGEQALVNFGKLCDDEDLVYVRNLSMECDFEILRIHSSYQEDILGVDDPEMIDPKFHYTVREVLEE